MATTTHYVLGGLEEDSSGTLTKYLGVPGLPSAVRVGTSGALSYLASDGLGSVSAALDGSGNVTAAQLYAPYGGLRYSSGTMPTAKGFTGQRADVATGLDDYGARYYDAVAGQFTSADTVANGLSPYAYIKGNPETLVDPTGHRYECPNGCSGGDGSGSGSGSGSPGINQGTNLSPSNGNPCDSVASCVGVQYPEGAPDSPCTNKLGVCGGGSDPQGLFSLLSQADGQGDKWFLLVGQEGIKTFLARLASLQTNIDYVLDQLIEFYSGGAILSGASGFIKELFKYIPPQILETLLVLGAGKVAQFTMLKGRLDNMIRDTESQLQEISDAMGLEPDHGAHTAIYLQAVYSGYSLLGPNPGDADYMPWMTESIKITDAITWP